ncbi:disintegrin and metalloproteinase domain-containing protein 29-like isoform X1 [Lepidochelys kempii]|uniref:disintegrin and metalloproteinase domain-containing protein 29-like isoform X1 n=1 Tax=Lepidochelys kempii TaxID=8472 RepID=UPI003C6FB131
MKSLGSIVQTPVDDILCWGTEFHAGRDTVDVGSVGDGTACGDNKICINRTCVNIKTLDYDCNYTKCNNRGMCNSKKNCHCNFGWAPPDCTLKGFGGSVDSGPPPTTTMSNSDIVIIMGIAIGSILLLLLVLSFAVHKRTQIARVFSRPSRKRQTAEGRSDAADTILNQNSHILGHLYFPLMV